MKIGWNLIVNPQALWVSVLRNKYQCGEGLIPMVTKKHNESSTLRGIRASWTYLLQGINWNLGNEDSLRFWRDLWLPSATFLVEAVVAPIPAVIIEAPLACFFDPGRAWISDMFSLHLPPHLTTEILLLSGPINRNELDSVYWRPSPDGHFSVSSAYDLLTEPKTQVPREPSWSTIWKWEGPHCIRCFLWKMLHNGLSTNNRRWAAHSADSPLCPLCSTAPETLAHLFRDCPVIKSVWLYCKIKLSIFFNHWVWNNILSNSPRPPSWSTMFGPLH